MGKPTGFKEFERQSGAVPRSAASGSHDFLEIFTAAGR